MLVVNLNSKLLNPAPDAPADVNTVAAKPAPVISVAWMLGASDAESRENCVPEMYYVIGESIRQYVRGYLSVNGSPMAVMVAEYYGVEVAA